MMKEKIRKILKSHYGDDMIDSIFSGRRKPKLDVICDIEDVLGVPAKAWRDIKSFLLTENTEKKNNK